MTKSTQKSVFLGKHEYACTSFYDSTLKYGGVHVAKDGNHIGSIIDLKIPEDIDDVDANVDFDVQVEEWIVDNEH